METENIIIENETIETNKLNPIILETFNDTNINKDLNDLQKNTQINETEPPNDNEIEVEKKQDETNNEKNKKNLTKKQKIFVENVFEKAVISRNINIKLNYIGKNFRDTIENILKSDIEGKCIVEGYVKPNSIRLISYSSGLIKNEIIEFVVVFECFICFPVEGMLINCIVKNITKAGIRAESYIDNPSPFVLFVSRDHHYNNSYFNKIKINDKIKVKVIGQRYELNDTFISIIGELKNF